MSNIPLIVIVGPTASGKSELAVRLAKHLDGEIISADSRQIYRALDIGTAKVSGKWDRTQGVFIYKKIPHHLIDEVDPKKTFSVAEYLPRAEAAIRDIARRGKIPILAGGAGFWIDTVVYDRAYPAVAPNPKLRKRLSAKSAPELFIMLSHLDPERARTVDQKNPRRLIRALEIALSIGRVPKAASRRTYRTLWIGLCPSQTLLTRRIAVRARRMIRSGLERETRRLLKARIPKKRMREFGFEYRAALSYIEKQTTREEFAADIIKGTHDYARRQMQWWRKNHDIRWVKTAAEAEKHARNFIRRDG